MLLVGAKGWQDDEIINTIERLRERGDIIQMPSHRVEDADLPAIYSGASVFVYPSIYEGFGIPPLEAMACGVPTVTSDNSSLPEAAGDASKLVDASSIESISAGLLLVLSDDSYQKLLVARGNQQVDKFSWRRAAERLIDLVLA